MKRALAGIEPSDVFYWFEEISRIPRGSFNEKAVSDYIMGFAKERGYDVKQDESWNLCIEVPATPGYESRPKILLQAHLDMVCKKDETSDHDFERDPIDIYVDGDWIRARHTTLGADNGSGLALIMAILDSKTIKHPPLQVLLTASEEVAGTGAENMDYRWPDGQYMINLDVFRDDAFLVSCAGISKNRLELPIEREAMAEDSCAFSVSLSGMKGGHSGETIHESRANAVQVLGELLYELRKRVGYSLISAGGEGLFNVISTVSYAEIGCAIQDKAKLVSALEEISATLCAAYKRTDPDMVISVAEREVEPDETALTVSSRDALISLLYLAPVGMYTVFDVPCTLAESSSNFGALTEEDGVLKLVMSIRANVEYRHDQLLNKYSELCGRIGAKLITERRIGSWEYSPVSPLRDTAARVYERQNGVKPLFTAIHAGVEVAMFFAKFQAQGRKVDAIGIGCNTPNAHSPEEALQISSVAKTYRLLGEILETIE